MYINIELIKNYMVENELSESEFCARCGIDENSLNKILSGEIDFFASALVKISKEMKVKISELCIC